LAKGRGLMEDEQNAWLQKGPLARQAWRNFGLNTALSPPRHDYLRNIELFNSAALSIFDQAI
jgi:hypothetical protein